MLWKIRVSLTVVIALLVCSPAFAQASDYDRRPRTASVSGRVNVGGKYEANVTVTITEVHPGIREARIFSLGGREFVDHYFYITTTDSEGRYHISGLPAGVYLVYPKAPAHVLESSLLGLDASVRITLDEGEAREKVDFALVRGGVITGRVTDEDGRPQVERYVKIEHLIGPDERRGVPNIDERLLETDDRGVYRIFGLRKGRYIVWAGGEHDTLRGAIRGKRTQVESLSGEVLVAGQAGAGGGIGRNSK